MQEILQILNTQKLVVIILWAETYMVGLDSISKSQPH
jgi:hypothetical protein